MKNVLAHIALLVAVSIFPAAVGCDKTVEEHKTEVKHPDGTVDTANSKTTQSPDGSTKTETKTENTK